MNLLTEYQRRHDDLFIPVVHDGICFFNDKNGTPSLIATTSLACRSFSTCYDCNDLKSTIIVELFVPGGGGSFNVAGHFHVDICSDLMKFLKENYYVKDIVPFYAKDMRDLEIWLWKFCSTGKMRGLKSLETDEKIKMIEQIVYACQKQSKLYGAYHIAYEAFLPNRRYMLFE